MFFLFQRGRADCTGGQADRGDREMDLGDGVTESEDEEMAWMDSEDG